MSEEIDLSKNISLRNIYFSQHRHMPPCGWIISILSSVSHPSLESVTISVDHDSVEEIEALQLSTLDRLFSNQPLSNDSTKLLIKGFGSMDREVLQAAYKDRLPKLDGKKRLKFPWIAKF